MPSDVELVLGYGPEEWHKLSPLIDQMLIDDGCIEPGFDWQKHYENLDDENNGFLLDLADADFDEIKKKELKNAHGYACQDMGWTFKKKKNDHVVYDTQLGEREFSIWSLTYYYDPDEAGHWATDALIGVNLSSRYFPTFIDWKSEHGTGLLKFSENQPEMVIAKKHIIAAIPELADAKWCCPSIFC